MTKFIKILFLFTLGVTLFQACNDTPQMINTSDDASIKRVLLIDSTEKVNVIPADFTIDNENNTIINIDSLPYGTKIDSIFLSIEFASTLGYIINDTISESYTSRFTTRAYDLTKPIKIKNLASNGKTTKEYTMTVNVHKVSTYKHVWTKLTDQISSKTYNNQTAFVLNDAFYFLYQTENKCKFSTSKDGENWSEKGVAQGLPLDISLGNNHIVHNGKVYILSKNQIYTSSNVQTWTKKAITGDSNYDYKSLLMFFKNQFWAIAQHKTDGSIKIANSTDAVNWEFSGKRSFDKIFPLSGFAVTTFKPNLGREKVVVVGGKNSSNKALNTRWAAENILGTDSLNWVNLSNTQSKFSPISNSSVAYYGSKLLLIGGYNNAGILLEEEQELRNSINEGLTWLAPDTEINQLPDGFGQRANISSFIHNNSLYLVGGVGEDKTYKNDIWKIRVNFYDFEDPSKY